MGMYSQIPSPAWRGARRRFDRCLARNVPDATSQALRTLVWLLVCGLSFVITASVLLLVLAPGDGGRDVSTGRFIVLYLACNADGILGATVSARSVLGRGFSHDVGMLAVRSYIAENETARFEALSPRAHVIWVDEVSNPAKLNDADVSNAKQCRYSKINAWSMTQYDRILLLDTDTFVMQNLDDVFASGGERGIAAVRDSVGDIFNTGVLLLSPDPEVARNMEAERYDHKSYNKGDQGFFNSFFGNEWDTLPAKYNVPIQLVDSAYVRAGLPDSLAVVHFTAEVKPWNFPVQRGQDRLEGVFQSPVGILCAVAPDGGFFGVAPG
jgi:glycogenin